MCPCEAIRSCSETAALRLIRKIDTIDFEGACVLRQAAGPHTTGLTLFYSPFTDANRHRHSTLVPLESQLLSPLRPAAEWVVGRSAALSLVYTCPAAELTLHGL